MPTGIYKRSVEAIKNHSKAMQSIEVRNAISRAKKGKISLREEDLICSSSKYNKI